MLGSAPIMAFVPATDLERARGFYEGLLGLSVDEINDFACVLRGGATTLRCTKVDQLTPQPFTVLGWQVADIHATIAHLGASGVGFLRFDGLDQDDAGVWRAPGGGQIAWFHDPDGNILSLTEF